MAASSSENFDPAKLRALTGDYPPFLRKVGQIFGDVKLRFEDDQALLEKLESEATQADSGVNRYQSFIERLELHFPEIQESPDLIEVKEMKKMIKQHGDVMKILKKRRADIELEIVAVKIRLGIKSDRETAEALIYSFNQDTRALMRVRDILKPKRIYKVDHASKHLQEDVKRLGLLLTMNDVSRDRIIFGVDNIIKSKELVKQGRHSIFIEFFTSYLAQYSEHLETRFNKILEYADMAGIDRRHIRSRRCIAYGKIKLRLCVRQQHPTVTRYQKRHGV